jgi:hypothetical protein
MCPKTELCLQNSHPPYELKTSVHRVNCHPSSMHVHLTVCETSDLVLN